MCTCVHDIHACMYMLLYICGVCVQWWVGAYVYVYIYDAHIYIYYISVCIYIYVSVSVYFLLLWRLFSVDLVCFWGQLLCVYIHAHVHEGINRSQNNIVHLYVLLVQKKKKKIKIEKWNNYNMRKIVKFKLENMVKYANWKSGKRKTELTISSLWSKNIKNIFLNCFKLWFLFKQDTF